MTTLEKIRRAIKDGLGIWFPTDPSRVYIPTFIGDRGTAGITMVVGHKARPHYADHGALFEMEVRVLAKRDFRIEMYNPPEGVLWEAQVYLTTLYENVYMRRGICIQNGVQVQATDKEVTYGEWNNLYGKFTVKTTVPAGDFRNDSQRATPIQYFDPNDNKWKKGRCLYHPDSSIIGCKGEDKSEWEDDFVGLCSPDLYKIFS